MKPVVVAGARELVPLLAKGLRAGGDASAVREGAPAAGGAVLVWIGKPDEDALRAATRARVPIVGVTDGESLPYVFDTDLVVVRPGEPMPVERVARAIAGALGKDGIGLAAQLPVLRAPLARELVRRDAWANALLAARIDPEEAVAILALNQARLARRIAAVCKGSAAALPVALPFAGVGASALVRRLPGRLLGNRVLRAAIAYCATYAVGQAARWSVRSGS